MSRCKEARIVAVLDEWAGCQMIPKYTSWDKAISGTNAAICGRYRPDVAWDLLIRTVVLEIDEYQHKHENYILRCELIRVSRIVEAFGGVPVHIIRYNPDAFKINGVTRRTMLKERLELLKNTLVECFDNGPDLEHRIVVQHLFFDQDGDDVKEFVVTTKYKTLEDYEQWVERTAPAEQAMETEDVPAYNVSKWGRRLKLEGSASSRLYTFSLRIAEQSVESSSPVEQTMESSSPAEQTMDTDAPANNVSRWGRRLKLEGSTSSRFYTFSLRIP